VAEAGPDAGQVAHAVAVAVGEGGDVQAVQDGVFVPEIDHPFALRKGWATALVGGGPAACWR
jgi:hypothetical protein